MAREPIAVDLLPERITVGNGASIFIGVTALPGQEFVTLQFVSGGTVAIGHPAAGVGFAAGYVLPSTPMEIRVGGTFWLVASGATSIVQIIRHRSIGFEGATGGFNGVASN